MEIFEPKRLFVKAVRVFVKDVRAIRMLLDAMSVVVLTSRAPLEALQLLQRPRECLQGPLSINGGSLSESVCRGP
jgi:hypothetical protein